MRFNKFSLFGFGALFAVLAVTSSYLIGVAAGRYVMRIEPLASASEEYVVRLVAPTIQALLDPRTSLPKPTGASS